ncbi:basic leucine zipper 43-like [Primulina huaijiensis]|uniref:basic leucine zipper 43-like n=1 Tax=Primulina huaijiensis TaxID=1492673 RepID=UPI003CC75997
MQPGEDNELHYIFPSNLIAFPTHFGITSNGFPDPLFQLHINPKVHEFNPQTTCLSNNTTSDEADEQQCSVIDERKQRRKISNRESARRSRMRKQKHLDELWSQVIWLRSENNQLVDKLNHVSEDHGRVVQENAQLKEETSELRQMIANMQLNSPYPSIIREFQDILCK